MGNSESIVKSEALSLAVAPLGAEMQYLRTAGGDDLLWHGDAAFWSGRAPVLFPIVGRAVDDTIAVGDHSASMAQHGFARRCLFELVEEAEDMCRHRLTDTDESFAIYPFAFELDVTHKLVGNRLDVDVEVVNKSKAPMPFGFGFHPAFCWPLPQAQGIAHHVSLAGGGTPEMVGLSDGLLRRKAIAGPFVEGELEIAEDLFARGALVFPNGADTLRYGPRQGLALEFEFRNLPDLALWRPQGAPFLCIEPWHGTASYVGDGPEIAQRPNSMSLQEGDAARFGYSVTVVFEDA